MKVKIMMLLVALFIAKCNFAQYKISGTISDATTKKPIVGALISITGLRARALTNEKGAYIFSDLKNGNYLFEVTSFAYRPLVLEIKIAGDTVLNFSLVKSITEMSEVVVTGVSRATELKVSPLAIETVNSQEMRESSSTNLIDALKTVPGISQITTGGAISKPVIRGLGFNRVLTLFNGIRQEGQQWGGEHGIGIDQYSIGRVEIIKGPGSLMYGSDGIAGVLNFLPPHPLPLGEVKTQVLTNYQSNNNLIGYSITNAGNKNGFLWRGRLSNKFAGDYQNKYDGKVFNSGFREYDGTLFLGLNKRWGHTYLTVNSYNNTLNLPEGERDSLGNFTYVNANDDEVTAQPKEYKGYHVGFPHQTINHLKVISNSYFILKKGSFKIDLAYQNNKRREYAEASDATTAELYFDLHTANYNFIYNFHSIRGWKTSVGLGGMYQVNLNKGAEVLIPEYNLFDAGLFATTQKVFFNKLNFSAGLRVDSRLLNAHQFVDENTTTVFTAFKRHFYGVSGSVGLSYQATKISTFKLNVSRGFRVPNMAELASNGRHEGTFRYEIGDHQLQPEFSYQVDFGYYLNSEHVTLQLTPFINFVDNFVHIQKLKGVNSLDSIPDPSDPAPGYKYAQGNAMLWGGEIYFDFHPHPLDWLHVANSFSYVNSTLQNQPDSMKYLPFTPAPRYRGEIKAQFPEVGKILSNVYIKFAVDYYFKQNHFFSAFDTETATPDYTLLSAGIGGNIKAFKRKDFFSLFVSVNNIANIAYQNHLSRLKYAPVNPATGRIGIFNKGRNISIKLILNI